MKTQNTKLNFNKGSLVELNSNSLVEINGGSSPLCIAVSVAATAYMYYTYNETGTDAMVDVAVDAVKEQF